MFDEILYKLHKGEFCKEDIVSLLSCNEEEEKLLFARSLKISDDIIKREVSLRGLIEISNICIKNCLYCGIRRDNKNVSGYFLSDEEIVSAALDAYKMRYASIVLQGGERRDREFTKRIAGLITEIKRQTDNKVGITLSLGEQSEETLKEWKEAGAHRYLLRIETSNPDLYRKIHPNDELHSFEKRLDVLHCLRKLDYQVGTGVMIGLPFQTIEDLANDLLFMYDFKVDMVGMGPYLEHPDTPLYKYRSSLMSQGDRMRLCLRMISILRIMMPEINIAATTACNPLIMREGKRQLLLVQM